MPSTVAYVPYYPDSRGNRLDGWTASEDQGGHILWLRGPEAVAMQILSADHTYAALTSLVTADSSWTHALKSDAPTPSPDIVRLLDLLKAVVTLPTPSGTEFALALDWYKIPQDGIDPYEWANTETANLVNRGKYRSNNNPTEQAKYGIRLVDKLCGVIEAHPTLQHVEIVVDVPGHDSKRVSFGSRVANTVAIRRGAEFVRTQAKSDFRPEAKNLSPSQRDEHLVNEFSVPNDVAGKTVLIVDDVFRSGTSMASVATTARSAGASTVFGLCGVRTMRR